MSLVYVTGMLFILFGAGLQQFAIYRRTLSSRTRKCNDSKATLLLYFSTGISCEIIGVFLVDFYSYLLAGCLHLLFFTYFFYAVPPTRVYKVVVGLFVIAFGMSIFVSTSQTDVSSLRPTSGYMFIGVVLSTISCYLSRFVQHNMAKVVMCSGFGSVISVCLKEISIMINGTLDGIYPSAVDIITILGIIIIASCIQCTIIKLLLRKYKQHVVYAGYYLLNILASFIFAQILFEEVYKEFKICFISIAIAVTAALMLGNDDFIDTNKLLQEV